MALLTKEKQINRLPSLIDRPLPILISTEECIQFFEKHALPLTSALIEGLEEDSKKAPPGRVRKTDIPLPSSNVTPIEVSYTRTFIRPNHYIRFASRKDFVSPLLLDHGINPGEFPSMTPMRPSFNGTHHLDERASAGVDANANDIDNNTLLLASKRKHMECSNNLASTSSSLGRGYGTGGRVDDPLRLLHFNRSYVLYDMTGGDDEFLKEFNMENDENLVESDFCILMNALEWQHQLNPRIEVSQLDIAWADEVIQSFNRKRKREDPLSTKAGVAVFYYWQRKRESTGQPTVRAFWMNNALDCRSPYAVFRPRPKDKMKLRKQRRSSRDAQEKTMQLMEDFCKAERLLRRMRNREDKKLKLAEANLALFDQQSGEMLDSSFVSSLYEPLLRELRNARQKRKAHRNNNKTTTNNTSGGILGGPSSSGIGASSGNSNSLSPSHTIHGLGSVTPHNFYSDQQKAAIQQRDALQLNSSSSRHRRHQGGGRMKVDDSRMYSFDNSSGDAMLIGSSSAGGGAPISSKMIRGSAAGGGGFMLDHNMDDFYHHRIHDGGRIHNTATSADRKDHHHLQHHQQWRVPQQRSRLRLGRGGRVWIDASRWIPTAPKFVPPSVFFSASSDNSIDNNNGIVPSSNYMMHPPTITTSANHHHGQSNNPAGVVLNNNASSAVTKEVAAVSLMNNNTNATLSTSSENTPLSSMSSGLMMSQSSAVGSFEPTYAFPSAWGHYGDTCKLAFEDLLRCSRKREWIFRTGLSVVDQNDPCDSGLTARERNVVEATKMELNWTFQSIGENPPLRTAALRIPALKNVAP